MSLGKQTCSNECEGSQCHCFVAAAGLAKSLNEVKECRQAGDQWKVALTMARMTRHVSFLGFAMITSGFYSIGVQPSKCEL